MGVVQCSTAKINYSNSSNKSGFSSEKQNFCQQLFNTTGDHLPILCNQENFLYKANSYKINKALPGAFIFFKPAHKDSPHSNGRPKNGMFTAVPKALKSSAANISPDHWRVQAIKIKLSNANLILVNTYFPNGPHTATFDDAPLAEVFEEIKAL